MKLLLLLLVTMITVAACSTEVSHTESDKPDWFGGGRTHTETTVTESPDGAISTEHSSQTTH